MNVAKIAGMTVAAMLLAAGAVQASIITIDTVTVGNPGNDPDTRYATPGFGAVAYQYSIGKYEVTAGQYAAFLNAVAKTDLYGLYATSMDSNPYGCQITRHGVSGSYTYDFSGRPSGTEADWANRPVNYVSWGDAARFANWLHNGQPIGAQDLTTTERGAYKLDGAMSNVALLAVVREPDAKWAITSEDEWYKAAYYYDPTTGNYFDYPTSNSTMPGRDMSDASGNNANYYSGGYLIGSPYYRTLVGEFQNSDSPYGTFDQGGNVTEWNEAVIGSSRGLRGGSFIDTYGAMLASNRSSFSAPASADLSRGFRVVWIPEPASMAVLALGSIAMLIRRRGLQR